MSLLDEIRRVFSDAVKVLGGKNINLFKCATLTCLSSVTLYDFNRDKSINDNNNRNKPRPLGCV